MSEADLKHTEKELYLIWTNSGVIYIIIEGEHKGHWCLGGSRSLVRIALFSNKKEAQRFRDKIKRQRPDLIKRTLIEQCGFVKDGGSK